MIVPIGSFLLQARICFLFFADFAFAALQNVTIDDTVSTGAVVPQYLPSVSLWNQGSSCSGCLVKPDSSKTYNGTWHDTTYSPRSGVAQSIEFTFTGSALYIYFILANTVPNATTLTSLNFFMDGTSVGSFTHSPTSSTNYQYNVPVYVNQSVPSGQHDMLIYPVNTGNSVLMLFDYLVYTTDPATTSSSASQSTLATPSPSLLKTQETTSGQKNIGIIGGAVGGAVALALVVASLLCYRRHKRREAELIRSLEVGVLESVPPGSAPPSPVPFEETQPRVSESQTRSKALIFRSLSPPTPSNPPSTISVSDHVGLVEQVELLRDEVSRLRGLRVYNPDPPQPPPKYES